MTVAEHVPTSVERDLVRFHLGDDGEQFTDDDLDGVIRIAFRHKVTDTWHTAARMLLALVGRP